MYEVGGINDNRATTACAIAPTYADQIVSRTTRLKDDLRTLRERTLNISGDPIGPPANDSKQMEPFNFLQKVIRDLEDIQSLVNDTFHNLEKAL